MVKPRRNNNRIKKKRKDDEEVSPHRTPKYMEHVTESDDEEIPEDEAFNSDDERRYGGFFTSSSKMSKLKSTGESSDDDSDDGDSVTSNESSGDDDDSSDDEQEVDDGGQYMLNLLDKLDTPASADKKGNSESMSASHMAQLPESEFSTAISQKDRGALTLDQLMQGLEDTAGFSKLQKTFQNVSKGSATPAPMDRVVADRTQRKIAYQKESKEISAWMAAVQENRQAETLDFKPNKERIDLVTRESLVDKFEPTTEFEKELEQALVKAGQDDEQKMLKAEEDALQDDLGSNRLTMEEYKRRRGQLAQMRALMSYYEQKRHHMKKIKSKKYRRIRKRQRERLKESELEASIMDADGDDNDLAKELQEKEEVARIQERMTLAHKNTSKWARRILKRGKKVDVDTRRALSAQLQRGDDLKKKMMSTSGDHSDIDGASDDGEEDLVESAKKVLADIQDHPTDRNGSGSGKNGLFKLSFMQRGIQKQRERAQEEARKLLRELESNERDDYDETAGDADSDVETNDAAPSSKAKNVASAKEMERVLPKGELIATSREFGTSNSIATTAGIDIEVSGNLGGASTTTDRADKIEDKSKSPSFNATRSEHTLAVPSQKISQKKEESTKQTKKKNHQKRNGKDSTAPGSSSLQQDESNPWMTAIDSWDSESSPKKEKKASKSGVSKAGIVEVEGAADLLLAADENMGSRKGKQISKSKLSGDDLKSTQAISSKEDSKKISNMTQEELIRKAFVTPSGKEIEDEFLSEKEAIVAENDPTRKVQQEQASNEVSGWGSWTGAGVALPPKRRRALPKKLQAPRKKEQKRKRQDDRKPNVIINEKRMKKTANNFMLGEIPHPFTSRAEYEQAMMGSLGKEWNVTSSFKNMTRPEILTRSGKIIQPISKRAKVARPAAKF